MNPGVDSDLLVMFVTVQKHHWTLIFRTWHQHYESFTRQPFILCIVKLFSVHEQLKNLVFYIVFCESSIAPFALHISILSLLRITSYLWLLVMTSIIKIQTCLAKLFSGNKQLWWSQFYIVFFLSKFQSTFLPWPWHQHLESFAWHIKRHVLCFFLMPIIIKNGPCTAKLLIGHQTLS